MKLGWTTFKAAGRRFYYVQWVNPNTGMKETRTTGETTKRAADDFARRLIEEIELTGNATGRTSWLAFIEDHAREVQAVMPAKTAALYRTAFNAIGRTVGPIALSDITARSLSKHVAALRESGLSEETVRCYLSHLRKALKWARTQGMIREVPDFPPVRRARGQRRAKGRAVTGEEFDRILSAVEPELTAGKPTRKHPGRYRGKIAAENLPEAVASVKRLLWGLYLGSFRLAETMGLRDGGHEGLRVDLDRDVPVVLVTAEDEKGKRDRTLPCTPDFVAFLRGIRPETPGGLFFPLVGLRGAIGDPTYVSALLSRIGKRAGVKVHERKGKAKYASAQDMRRSFGTRWAARLPNPRDLQMLMRHSDLKTTYGYYVFDEAEKLAARIAEAWGADAANTPANTGESVVPRGPSTRHKSKQA